MAITRGQTTGKLRTATAGSLAGSMGGTPQSGSLVVVAVWAADGIHWATGDVTDNQGNTYYRACALSRPAAGSSVAIYYAEGVVSSGTFTITVNPANHGNTEFVMVATEFYGSVATRVRLLDRTHVNAASGTAVALGPTSALNMTEALVFCAFVIDVSQASIVVESVSPSWTQEAEELDTGTYIAGEAVSRVVSAGGAQSCNWTAASSSQWIAVMACFSAN